jgi:hypothetical protein
VRGGALARQIGASAHARSLADANEPLAAVPIILRRKNGV